MINNTFFPQNMNMPIFTNINQQKHIFKNPLSINDFEILNKNGKGAHGSVFKAMYKTNGQIYALKQYLKAESNGEKNKDYIREKAVLYDLTQRNYPTIVKLYADFEDNTSKYLVLEFVEGKTLRQITIENSKAYKAYIPQMQIINILTQMLQTLQFLHEKCFIIHRDIKPDNIILQNNNQIKLLDFGISVYLVHMNKQLKSSQSVKGELHYVPPEILFGGRKPIYDYKMDIFSLGFTMFNIMNPSNNCLNLPQITDKVEGNYTRIDQQTENTFYAPWLIDFVQSLYSNNQKKRPTASDALQLLFKLQTDPNVMQIYTQIKMKNPKNINNINNFVNRQNSGINNNAINNINNNVFTGIPINPMSFSTQNMINVPNIGIPFNREFRRMNSENLQNNESDVGIFLNQRMGNENKIISSMKSLLEILYRLDVMNNNFIRKYIKSVLSKVHMDNNNNQYFINLFQIMLNNVEEYDKDKISLENYNTYINEFLNQVVINNNSGISGTRPIILFFMMTSIFKDEFNQYFNNYQNNIFDNMIKNNFMVLNDILPMNDQMIFNKISQLIFEFKNTYKGPFVDNFYFIVLSVSKCPNCNTLFEIRIHVNQFLQLDVKNPENNITEIINDYFFPKIGFGNYNCKNCGQQGKKSKKTYCLNLPNYLMLEFEDKNKINFNDNITLSLVDGQIYTYQYLSGIYKFKDKDVTDFAAVIKNKNNYLFYHDDKAEQCPQEFINLECPSLAIYKKIS